MGKSRDTEKINNIIKLVKLGVASTDIASMLNVSEPTVHDYKRIQKLCEAGDIESLRNMYNAPGGRAGKVKFVMELNNMPTDILDQEPLKKTPDPEPEVKQESVPTDTTVNLMYKLLRELENVNENLRDLMDAVIPKYTQDIIQTINVDVNELHGKCNEISIKADANADMLQKEIERSTGMLERINGQFKKGGKW